MKRRELLRQMQSARTPDEIASALAGAREWLGVHPKDADMRFAVAELLRFSADRAYRLV